MTLIPHRKRIFLQEPGQVRQRVAEMTFWFALFQEQLGGLRFRCSLQNINEASIDGVSQNSINIIDCFEDPKKFVLDTAREFIARVEKAPLEFLSKAQPMPNDPNIIVLNRTSRS